MTGNQTFTTVYNPPYSATNLYWTISPTVSGGASFSNGVHTGPSVNIMPGSVANNYDLTTRAYYYTPSQVYTSSCDTSMLYVVNVKINVDTDRNGNIDTFVPLVVTCRSPTTHAQIAFNYTANDPSAIASMTLAQSSYYGTNAWQQNTLSCRV